MSGADLRPAGLLLAVAAAIGIASLAATPHPPHNHEARRNQRGWDR